jgi:hypothetical protein
MAASSSAAGPPAPRWEGIAPGLGQVVPRERHVALKTSGTQRPEVVYGVPRLGPDRAGAARWLGLVRQHWHLEHKRPWGRAVTRAEDRSQGRSGSIPQVRAAFRHTAIGLMPWAGETNIAAGCRRFAAQPWAALALIGMTPDH